MTKHAHELQVGDEIEPKQFTISALLNQQCMFAQEDFHPRYLPRDDDEAEIVHPALVLQMLANTKSPSYHVPENVGAILAEAETTFVAPLRVGTRYTTRWTVDRTYTKRGKQYQEIRAQIADDAGSIHVRRTLQLAYIPKEDSSQ